MHALVTGCAGFIGSHLVDSLLADGAEVRGVDCFTESYGRDQKVRNLEQAKESSRFSFAELDLAEAPLDSLLGGVDVVFHLAAEPGVRPSWGSRFGAYARNNVFATQRLLETLKASPETRFVFASSSSVYGRAESLPTPESTVAKPLSPYGVTKLAGEHLVRIYGTNYGVEGVSLRYFSVYGPRQRPDASFHRFIRAAIEGKPVTLYGDGSQARDFTYVSDVIDATKAAATSPVAGDAINVGAGTSVTLVHALDVIAELAGRTLEIDYAPRESGHVEATEADTTRARERLGFEPAVGLVEGLGLEFEWIVGAVGNPQAAS